MNPHRDVRCNEVKALIRRRIDSTVRAFLCVKEQKQGYYVLVLFDVTAGNAESRVPRKLGYPTTYTIIMRQDTEISRSSIPRSIRISGSKK